MHLIRLASHLNWRAAATRLLLLADIDPEAMDRSTPAGFRGFKDG